MNVDDNTWKDCTVNPHLRSEWVAVDPLAQHFPISNTPVRVRQGNPSADTDKSGLNKLN